MRGLLAGLTKEKGDAAVDSSFGVYSSHWGSLPEQAVVKKTVADIETDFLFLVPTQIALQLHANNTRSAVIGGGGRWPGGSGLPGPGPGPGPPGSPGSPCSSSSPKCVD